MSDRSPTPRDLGRALALAFFAPDVNGVTQDAVRKSPILRASVRRLMRGAPTVLPFRRPGGGTLEWFGVARTEPDLRHLRAGIESFVGSTWSDLRLARVAVGGTTPTQQALAAYSGGRVFRFSGHERGTIEAVGRMLSVWEAQPGRSLRDVRSPGLVRRAFEVALATGDAEGAREALATLRASGVLDHRNGQFLEVQRLDASGRWSQVLSLEGFSDLIKSRRPLAVTDAVLRAAYHVHLAGFDAAGDADGALAAYRGSVAPLLSGLIDGSPPVRTRGARVVLAAAAADRGDPVGLARLGSALRADGGASPIVATWEASAMPSAASDPGPGAGADPLAEAERVGRLDKEAGLALALAATSAPPQARAATLLSLANDLRTVEAIRASGEALNALPEAMRSELLAQPWVARVLDGLEARTPATMALPESWADWLALVRDEALVGGEALAAARLGAPAWTVEGLLAGRLPEAVADEIGRVPPVQSRVFSDALPLLLGTLQSDPSYPDPALAPVYGALLEHVAYEAPPTAGDARLYADLLPAVLHGPLGAGAYGEALAGLMSLLDARGAAPPVDVVLDVLDETVTATCSDPEARLRLLTYAVRAAERHAGRWEDEDRDLLASIAEELGHADAIGERPAAQRGAPPPSPNVLAALAGKRVAIYTLTPEAAARAASVLERVAPGVRVDTSAAKGGDERLRAMAENADLFVMVTRSATHAATDFIEAHRGGRPILRPAGKGTSSILRELREFLA